MNARKNHRPLSLGGIFLLLAALACNISGPAMPTEVPPTAPQVGEASPTPSPPPAPTDTPVPDISGPGGCTLNAAYVADVTVPDNTEFAPGEAFTKVWRVRNSGTCTWEAGTQLVFVSGEPMGGPAAVDVPSVAPGSNTDISVGLVAPTAPGTYRGTWQLQSPEGVRFGSQIYVQIIVPEPATATPTPTEEPTETPTVEVTETPTEEATATPTATSTTPPEVTVTLSPSSKGQVDGGGEIHSPSNAGDTPDNLGLQGFLTFDVSGIPDSATILSAKLEFISWDTLGDPFGSLGCLRVYHHNYGTLDAGDYTPPPVTGALARFCSEADLSDPSEQALNSTGIGALQDSLGGDQFQIRLQFNEHETDGDGVSDCLRPTLQLEVTYQP